MEEDHAANNSRSADGEPQKRDGALTDMGNNNGVSHEEPVDMKQEDEDILHAGGPVGGAASPDVADRSNEMRTAYVSPPCLLS